MLKLLPKGQAWPRYFDSTLALTIAGLADYYGTCDARAADLLERESDPRSTVELLPDWERAWGLPDPCFAEALTIPDRQRVLVMWMTLLGAQSRQFFIETAARLGYTITITEYAPFMCGVSMCGDTTLQNIKAGGDAYHMRWEIGGPEMRFYWTIHVTTAALTWFRCGSGQCGVDPHLRIGLATDLVCILHRWKPAQTEIVFDYSNLEAGDPMEGTP